MKKVSFKYDENGEVKVVEDPNGQWRLHALPNGGTFLQSPLPPEFTAGVDPYQAEGEESKSAVIITNNKGEIVHPKKETDKDD